MFSEEYLPSIKNFHQMQVLRTRTKAWSISGVTVRIIFSQGPVDDVKLDVVDLGESRDQAHARLKQSSIHSNSAPDRGAIGL